MKNKEELDIVFMGTPAFAVTILEQLIKEGYNIKAVVTAPDRPAGRGRKLKGSAVKECAMAYEIPILQPTNLKDEAFVSELKGFKADLFIVVAFRMLPKVIWEIPPMGTFNLHGSLLPQYRGAAPINWAIINGEKETGVTSFFIDEKIDTGEIILSQKMPIHENETAGELHDRMMVVAAQTVADTVELIRKGEAQPKPQPEGDLKEAPKIHKQDCLIDFHLPINEIHNFILGMSPYPTAWMKLKNKENGQEKTLKVFRSEFPEMKENTKVKLEKQGKKLILNALKGSIHLLEVQLEGKKRLDYISFLAGFNPEEWEIVH